MVPLSTPTVPGRMKTVCGAPEGENERFIVRPYKVLLDGDMAVGEVTDHDENAQ
jgi:hypothetical protein